MYLLKELKKLKTYFNNFIPNGARNSYEIRFTRDENNVLSASMSVNNSSIFSKVYSVNDESHTFTNCVVSFADFYDALGQLKGVKEVDVLARENTLILKTEDNEITIKYHRICTRSFEGEVIANIPIQELATAFFLNEMCSKNGVAEFDSNIVISISNNVMYMNSNTNGLYVGNKILVKDGRDISFYVSYKDLSSVKKWLTYAVSPKNIMEDNVKMSIYEKFIQMEIQNISIIFSVDLNAKVLAEKFNAITDYNYPHLQSIPFDDIRTIFISAVKEKQDIIDYSEIFHKHAEVTKPLMNKVVNQIYDLGSEPKAYLMDFSYPIIEIDMDMMSLDSKLLIFLKGENENDKGN